MNGIQNAVDAGGPTPPVAFADFKYLTSLLDHLYDERMIVLGEELSYAEGPTPVPLDRLNAQDLVAIKKAGYEVRSLAENKGYVLAEPKRVRGLRIHSDAAALPECVEATRLLRLRPQQGFYPFELQPSGQMKPPPTNAQETKLTITTRSLLETMFLLSHSVAVPPEHVRKGLVTVTRNPDGTLFDWGEAFGDLFHVCVAKHKPKNAAVSVKYRGYWYYIDEDDPDALPGDNPASENRGSWGTASADLASRQVTLSAHDEILWRRIIPDWLCHEADGTVRPAKIPGWPSTTAGTILPLLSVALHLDHRATLMASQDEADFEPYEKLGFQNDADRETSFFQHALLWAEDVERIAITRTGTIHGAKEAGRPQAYRPEAVQVRDHKRPFEFAPDAPKESVG